MNAAATFPLRIAGLTIDPVRRRVAGPAGEYGMEPLVMQLLLQLVGAKGEVLPRRELFDRLWGKAQVGDDSLNRLVGSLRRVLRDASDGGVQIETIPRVGYRLIADSAHAGAAPPMTRRAIVVGGGSLLLAASGAGLSLARRNSRVAEVERWTDRGDVLLRDADPLEAGEALPSLRSALAIDPDNAKALGLLALTEETRANNGGTSNPGDTLRLAEQAARASLQRDPSEPHARLALVDMTAGSLDWAEMEDRLQSLRASAPTNIHVLGSLTTFLEGAGLTSKSWLYNEQAAAAAPSSPTPQWRRALRLWTAGHIEEALKLTERLLPLWPRHAFVWNARFMILAFTGRTGAAAAMLRNTVAPPRNAHPVRPAQWMPTLEAFADPSSARIARAKEANMAAAQLNPGQAIYAAMSLSQLGPIAAHSFVANAPSWCRTQWLFMPPAGNLRGDVRFDSLCQEIGLTRYWRQRGLRADTRLTG